MLLLGVFGILQEQSGVGLHLPGRGEVAWWDSRLILFSLRQIALVRLDVSRDEKTL